MEAKKVSDKETISFLSGKKYKIILFKKYKHNTTINVFKYKIKILEPRKKIFMKAFNKMIDNSIKDFPNGRIKIVAIHEIIETKHDKWPIRTYDNIKEFFFNRMVRLLNSAEELNLEEVIFEVSIIPNKKGKGKGLKILDEINKRSIIRIKNNDTICLARAIVTAIIERYDLTDSQKKYVKQGRSLQKSLATDLHENSNVNIKEEGNDLDDLKIFENYLNVRIIVFTSNNIENILYSGNEKFDNQLYFYYHDDHFDVITNVTGFIAKRRFCKTCLIGYSNQHTCKDGKLQSNLKQWTCEKCNKTFSIKYQKPEKHICDEITCCICYEKYMKGTEHLCYMNPLIPKEVKDNKYIYFDFEANQETGIHIMNFCIVYDLEYIYCFRKNYIKIFKCDFNINDIDLSKIDLDNCFDDAEKIECESDSVIDNFCEYFIRDKFTNYTFISHYGKGYDMQPILGWMIQNRIEHNYISSGLKITSINVNGINLRFIDSINFTLCGLAAFPKTFGFKGNKGYFPHYFNTTDNQNYKGVYPAKEYYGYNTMTIKNKELFDKWYNNVKDKEFKFYKEIFYYCLLDVLILAKGCTIYKDLFIKITDNYIDPFQSVTIAQCCTKIFKTLMLEEETIGIHKTSTFEEIQSKKAIQWLEYLSNKEGIMIQHCKRGGEKKLFINGRYYKLDGYYYDGETKTRNIYEFFGCYFHGCPKCYHPDEICKRRSRKTMKELYDNTLKRLDIIKDYFHTKVNIHTIWECEFDKNKYPKVDPHLKPINKRDAFYGGRTKTIQLYNNLPHLKARYVDFCSLYPWVNKFCEYPIGHPVTYIDVSIEKYLINKYFGIIKCKILPPRGLYHPVLPYKQHTYNNNNHKLIFGLCKTCMTRLENKCTHITEKFNSSHGKVHAIKHCKECKQIRNEKCKHSDEERAIIGTWSTIEINKAIEKGYKLLKIYELEHFEKTSKTIFEKYVNTFMKYKQEASGCECNPKYCKPDCKNDHECETKIQYIADNAAYDLDIDKIKKNAGLRAIAKICLNSLWGHFGMKDNYTQKEYCFNSDQLTNIVFNEKFEDVNLMILDNDTVLTEYQTKEYYKKPNTSVNIYIALFSTAHARLKLYELLDTLQERVMYLDSDSCIYQDDDGSEACKKIESMMGTKLGDLTDEIVSKHNANHIVQFVSSGPKDYSMKLDTGKIVSCCKGFRLNAEVEEKITMDKKIKIVTDENESYETITYNQITSNKKDRNLKTVEQVKMYDYEFDKRMIHNENVNVIRSFPYGY